MYSDTRHWSGRAPGSIAVSTAPAVRHRARRPGEIGPGREVDVVVRSAPPLKVVARLWAGVLSMFVLIVSLGLVGMTLGAWALGYRPVVVSTGSMAPSIRPGDVVITRAVDRNDDLGTQTVINFEDPVTGDSRIHRVVEVDDDGYRTKGDANSSVDAATVPRANVKGAGLVLAPFAGFLPLWMDQGRWFNVVATLAGLVAVSMMSRRSWMWATERVR